MLVTQSRVWIWLACSAVFAGVAFFLFGGVHALLLIHGWASTQGRVISTLPRSHGTAIVDYGVGGVKYEAQFAGASQRAGETVEVYYARNDPKTASLETPSSFLHNVLILTALSGMLFGLLPMAGLKAKGGQTALRFRLGPRMMTSGVLIGVCAGGLASAMRNAAWSFWVPTLFVSLGAALLCSAAFRSPMGDWITTIKSRAFLIGVALIVAGGIIRVILSAGYR